LTSSGLSARFLFYDKYLIMSNVNNLLAALGDEINAISQRAAPDAKEIARKLPLRSLTGDHISGGKIHNFASTGITDTAAKTQLTVNNDGVTISNLFVENLDNLTISGTLKTKILEVDEIRADIKFEKDVPIVFSGDTLDGKGLLWAGRGNTKQLIFNSNPDRFFVSEHVDLARGKSITINNIKVIDEKELGPTITKSNLREVGHLKGLIVDGSLSVGQCLVFDANTSRLGLGTENPNAAVSILDDGVEIVLGTKDTVKAFIGTYASNALELGTDNTARIILSSSGNITLGNPKLAPAQVHVHGKLSVRVSTPDPEVDLHVNGAVRFNNRLQKYDHTYPTNGSYNEGDIVWNIQPRMNSYVGWVCIQTGSPGLWSPFGKIGNS
jgi:hypothetical protein